jgi:hypothetical protein
LNRSLPVLTAQACSRRSVSCHLQFLSRCTFFFCRAAFLCPVTSLARRPFFLFFAAAQRAPDRFFCRAQQRPVSSPAARAGLFFLHEDAPLTGHFLPMARSVFFCRDLCPCPVTSRAPRNIFLGCACRGFFIFPVLSPPLRRAQFSFACSHALSGLVCMQNLFFACSVWSLPPCRARRFFVLLALHEDMRVENLLFGQQQGCACRFFLLFCPVTSSLLSARRFSWTFLLCPRTSRACVSGAPTFFSCPVTSSSCAQI